MRQLFVAEVGCFGKWGEIFALLLCIGKFTQKALLCILKFIPYGGGYLEVLDS